MPEICLNTKVWRSGAAWVAQMIAQGIAEQGASIAFVAPRAQPETREPSHVNLIRIETPRELVGGASRLARIRASLARILSGTWHLFRLRASTRVYIFSIPEPLVFTLPVFALLRLSGARVILIVHDSEPHAWSLPKFLRGLERGAHALSYRLSSTLVALTPTVRDALVKDFGIPKTRIAVIPHGPFSIGNTGPLPGNGRLLIFGSLRRNKCVLEAIEGVVLARKTGRDVVLVLAGVPLKQEAGYWEQCLEAMKVDPAGFDVRPGFVPDEALPELVAGIDAFVLAYRDFNSQSGVGVLAALAGRPVIGTASGGLGEMFDRGMCGERITGEVTPDNIAAAIAAFSARPAAEWDELAKVAATKIASTLRWDDIADQYIDLARDHHFEPATGNG